MGTVRQTKNRKTDKILKNIALIGAQIATMVQLQACKGTDMTAVQLDPAFNPIIARIDKNIDIVKDLANKNLIQSQTKDNLVAQLEQKKTDLTNAKQDFDDVKQSKDNAKIASALNNTTVNSILSSLQAVWIPQSGGETSIGDITNNNNIDAALAEMEQSTGIQVDTYKNGLLPVIVVEAYNELYDKNSNALYSNNSEFADAYVAVSRLHTQLKKQSSKTSKSAFAILNPQDITELEKQTDNNKSGLVYALDYNKMVALFGEGASTDDLATYMKALYDTAQNKQLKQNGDWTVDTDIVTQTGIQISGQQTLDKLFQPVQNDDGSNMIWTELLSEDSITSRGLQAVQVLGTEGDASIEELKGLHTEYADNNVGNGLSQQPAGWQDEPGYDIQLKAALGGSNNDINQPVFGYLRVIDLNTNMCKDLLSSIDNGVQDRMIYANGNFYLMVYPMAVIDSMTTDGSGSYTIGYKVADSQLLSFKDRQILNVQQIQAVEQGQQSQKVDELIQLGDGTIGNFQQFIIQDVKGTVAMSSTDSSTQTGQVPAFVLRDYLEGSYTPGVLNDGNVDESLVCYGRLLRFNLQGATGEQHNIADTIAYYIDQQHSKISKTGFSEVYPWQLANAADLFTAQTSDHKIKRLPQQQESVGSTTNGDPQATNVQNLPQETVSQISPVAQFPGDLDRWDADKSGNTQKPRMYAVATTLDLNQSGILNHWMQSEDQQLSLAWWQTWLNSHSYNYHLTDDVINKWINAEYNIVLGQRDFVIMDTDKVNKTNNTFVDKALSKASTTWKTFMVFIGIVCVIIQTVFILCWTFDVVVGLDLHLTEKIQGGRYTAVKDKSELMNMYGYMGTGRFNGYSNMGGYNSGPRPIDFVGVLCKILWLMGLGIILMTVNPLTIFQVVLKLAQGIAKISENVTAGITGR